MTTIIPITLTKNNLGKRHHQLNALVQTACENGVPFETVRDLPEQSPVDRVFKIDLASKLKNVDYIIQNIKDEDMLYVNKALRCKWLLESEYQHIICPNHLEDMLYPDMATTAVSKMKNWLFVNLKNPERCEQFYSYYYMKNFEFAIKFLGRCSGSFIVNEAPNIFDKLSPHYFKILCESQPRTAKIYFDMMPENDKIKSNFLKNHIAYYDCIKVVLKTEPNTFFDVTEKYFNNKLSRSMTKYILKNHKDKFQNKPELYSSSLLHMDTLAECLNSEECKELVLVLARAKYLADWFSYKNVEPLIKMLGVHERPAFKKRVFVDKDIGEVVETWPYSVPVLPSIKNMDTHIFKDVMLQPHVYEMFSDVFPMGRILRSLRCDFSGRFPMPQIKTNLNKLFDEFRFVGFGQTLFELRRRIKVESSSQYREHIMLVLISKSGAKLENLATLLELLVQHSNEPVHVRAAVVRSLAKRAAVWRLGQDCWEHFLTFSSGLGLDGKIAEADCQEGLHSVVLRSLLRTGDCESAIRDAFLRQFSDLKEYPINVQEKKILSERLPVLILAAVQAEFNPRKQAHYLNLLLDTLQSYKTNVESTPLLPAVVSLVHSDASVAKSILQRLFDSKIARRSLFRENFSLIQNDASYLNALRHDASVLDVNKFVDLLEKGKHRMDQFLRKIAIYFSEIGGLCECYLAEIRIRVFEKPDVKPAISRALCFLQTFPDQLLSIPKIKNKPRLIAAVNANIHVGRPKYDITKIDIKEFGAKGCANKVLVCPVTQIDCFIQVMLKSKNTVRIAILLSERMGKEAEVFTIAASMRPIATLKAALKYFRRRGESLDLRVWDVTKNLLKNIDYTTDRRKYLRRLICEVDCIPIKIRPEYCSVVFLKLRDKFREESKYLLYNMEKLMPDMKDDFVEKIVLEYLYKLTTDESKQCDRLFANLYFQILAKHMLFSKTVAMQNAKIEILIDPLFTCLKMLQKTSNSDFIEIFEVLLRSLQTHTVFFDVTFVSPIPVMDKILSWMHMHLPIETNFKKYVYIHSTMLYFKAIRQSMFQRPDIFADEKLKMSDGVDFVGHVFGQYIAREVKDLKLRYFESIIDIYHTGFTEYIDNYFTYTPCISRFISAISKGIVEASEGAESRIAVHLLDNAPYSLISPKSKLEIMEIIKNIENIETKFFAFAQFC